MRYRTLGSSGLRVSVVGLGGNTFGPPRLSREQALACIEEAHALGINFIDTALRYGGGHSEAFIGNALQGRRNEWVLATKFSFADKPPQQGVGEFLRAQCETSLQRLRTDRIDLYQLHFHTEGVPLDEVADTLARLVREGKVLHVGQCNLAAWRHAEFAATSLARGGPPLVSCQQHFNLLRRHVEFETLPYCRARGIAFLPYFPLAGGYLTDKYEAGQPAPAGSRGAAGSPIVRDSRSGRNEMLQPRLKAWARERGHSLGEAAIAWLLAHEEIPSVIAGVSSPAQVRANAQAAHWVLTPAELAALDALAAWDGTGVPAELHVS